MKKLVSKLNQEHRPYPQRHILFVVFSTPSGSIHKSEGDLKAKRLSVIDPSIYKSIATHSEFCEIINQHTFLNGFKLTLERIWT